MNKLNLLILVALLLSACSSKPEIEEKSANMSIAEKTIIDLSHDFSGETIYWVNAKEFKLDTVFKGQNPNGFFYAANNFSAAEHGGTHLDAPIHFSEGKQSVEQIPLERLIGEGINIDVSGQAVNNPEYLISVNDFKVWEERNGKIPKHSIVLLQTGYSKYYPNKAQYLGTDHRGDEAIKELHFPGLSPEAAEWLVNNRNIKAVGIDTPSIDYGQSTLFKSHVILLSENIPVFENVTNLNKLPSAGFEVIALPMKIKAGSGAPLRIIALLK
ncbi:cyclase family protein [Roseivirga pacifica]|uniref:cyclase family protein n=1 Tax=Roseivirga pacifica TaxID=1267423 RepID=UPI002094449E|nr:cyclase family protein [Roseivirga pacifica]MCO6358492.1 cyclase family protein [Roseivirga pacifica]MCO6369047.1 cyclase family protein [Roseivirga pacifica]MCO6372249.1 cyclase family protein [Roseivirga pacifica]MCO6374223.1 cyclase family protein [Roseivirga pacifica]MCO6380980.1 cyclase family protein [Roseivirga pacifica]